MKLSQILMEHIGLFSKDAKLRLANGQVEINGEKSTSDIDVDVKILEDRKLAITDAGTFLCSHILTNELWRARMLVFGVDALWSFDNDLSKFFSDFLFIKISKRQIFVIEKNIK